LPRWRDAWALAALVLSNGLVLMMFFVIDRYRAPLLAALLPFAAFVFVTLYRLASDRRWAATGGLACLLIALTVAIARPFESPQPTIRPTDVYVSFHYVFGPRIGAAIERRDFAAAADGFDEFFAVVPPEIERLSTGPDDSRLDTLNPGVLQMYRKLFSQAAKVNLSAGRREAAQIYAARVEWIGKNTPR
jgi:hypothetical protein